MNNRALEAYRLVRESYISNMRVQLLYPELREQAIKNLSSVGVSPEDLGITIDSQKNEEANDTNNKFYKKGNIIRPMQDGKKRIKRTIASQRRKQLKNTEVTV